MVNKFPLGGMERAAEELMGAELQVLPRRNPSSRPIGQRLASSTRSLRQHRPFVPHSDRARRRAGSAASTQRSVAAGAATASAEANVNQHMREGASEAELVQLQVWQ